jgi:hypothetical protein
MKAKPTGKARNGGAAARSAKPLIDPNTGKPLPKRCECGGKMEYAFSFGRVWSCCSKCTPVSKVNVTRGKVTP